MRKSSEIQKELNESKELAKAEGLMADEKDFIEQEIADLEKELASALEAEKTAPKKEPAKKAAPKKKETTKKPKAKKTVTTEKNVVKTPKTPKAPKEKAFIIFEGKKIFEDDAEYCSKLVQAWRQRKEAQKKAAGKRKTKPVTQRVAANVASAVSKGIETISAKEIKDDPKKAIAKMERLEKAGKEFLDAFKDILGEKITQKEIKEEFEGLDRTIQEISKKYLKTKMANGGEVTSYGLSFSKNDYDVNVNPQNLEVDVNIKESDSVDHYALNDTDADWNQHSWGYMVYPKSVEQLYKVLKALNCKVSINRLKEWNKNGGSTYANGGDIKEGDKVIITTNDLGEKYKGMSGVVTPRKLLNDKYSILLEDGMTMAFSRDEFKHNNIKPKYAKGGDTKKTYYYAVATTGKSWDENEQEEFYGTWKDVVKKAYDVAVKNKSQVRVSESEGFNNQGHYFHYSNAPKFEEGGSIEDVSGNYYSSTDFVESNNLMPLAKELFGESWESGGDYDYDTEEVKMLVKKLGGGYKVVYVDSEKREKFEAAKQQYFPKMNYHSNDGDIFVVRTK